MSGCDESELIAGVETGRVPPVASIESQIRDTDNLSQRSNASGGSRVPPNPLKRHSWWVIILAMFAAIPVSRIAHDFTRKSVYSKIASPTGFMAELANESGPVTVARDSAVDADDSRRIDRSSEAHLEKALGIRELIVSSRESMNFFQRRIVDEEIVPKIDGVIDTLRTDSSRSLEGYRTAASQLLVIHESVSNYSNDAKVLPNLSRDVEEGVRKALSLALDRFAEAEIEFSASMTSSDNQSLSQWFTSRAERDRACFAAESACLSSREVWYPLDTVSRFSTNILNEDGIRLRIQDYKARQYELAKKTRMLQVLLQIQQDPRADRIGHYADSHERRLSTLEKWLNQDRMGADTILFAAYQIGMASFQTGETANSDEPRVEVRINGS